MTTTEAMLKVREILLERYPDYSTKTNPEKLVLAASVLADDIRVREESGNNMGDWVEAILGAVKLEGGYPWCAAMVEFLCDIAGINEGPSDRASAAVNEWFKWGKANGKLTNDPKRGDLCLWIKEGGNHMGIVVQASGGYVNSIEGNTSAGVTGSQRDGGGCYRRSRLKTSWTHFIRF